MKRQRKPVVWLEYQDFQSQFHPELSLPRPNLCRPRKAVGAADVERIKTTTFRHNSWIA